MILCVREERIEERDALGRSFSRRSPENSFKALEDALCKRGKGEKGAGAYRD